MPSRRSAGPDDVAAGGLATGFAGVGAGADGGRVWAPATDRAVARTRTVSGARTISFDKERTSGSPRSAGAGIDRALTRREPGRQAAEQYSRRLERDTAT